MDAERVVVEITAKLDGFTPKVQVAASQFDGSMKVIERSADKAEKAVTRSFHSAAQRSRNLGFQISDIGTQLASGTSPFLILAQQGPQVANAIDGASGAVGRFATFLSGPWGAAILAATTILGGLLAKNIKFGDAIGDEVDKLREAAEKTDTARRAHEIFSNTIEGVTQALEDERKALDALNLVQDTSAEKALKGAEAERQHAINVRQTTVALLEQAKAQLQAIEANGLAGNPDAPLSALILAQDKVKKIAADLAAANAKLAEARSNVVEARADLVVEQAMASQEEKINKKYDQRIDAAKKVAIANGAVEASLKKQIDAINAAREAELKRYRDTQKAAKDASLPQVTGAEIARALGTTITSGTRTAAHNKEVGGAANSFHLIGQAIDIPLTVNGKPLTKEGIRAVLEPLGVQIKELLGPGDKGHSDNFHIAFSKTRLGPDRIAEAAQKDADAEERRRQAFENELASLQGDEISARQALITSAEEIARLESQAVEVARQKYDDNLNSLVEQKKLTAEEAAELRGINDERAKLRQDLIEQREQERKFRTAEADRQRAADFASEERTNLAQILQGQEDLARTQKERRDIEHKLLDLQFDEEKARNDYLIAYAERLKTLKTANEKEQADADEAAREAKLRNQTLPQRKQNALAGSDEKTAGPLKSFFDEIPKTADQINEALENIAAGGLATFTDALTDAIVNFTSLGDVGLAVLRSLTAGLVKMAIQQVLLHTIGKALSKASVASTVAEGTASASAWAPAAAFAALATLGANAGPAISAIAGTVTVAHGLALTGLKGGGRVTGPGGPLDDKILLWGSNGEFMMRAGAVSKLGLANLEFMNRTGQLPAFADGGPIGRSVVPVNAPITGRGSGAATLAPEAVRQLAGIVRDAVSAMPDLNLYPTLEPAKALEAALASPGGQRAFFKFMQDNTGKFRSQLGH